MSSPHHFMPLLPLGCPDNAKYSGTALKISGCLKVMPWAMLYLTLMISNALDYCIRNALMWGVGQWFCGMETNRQPSIQINPQICSADLNPLNDLGCPHGISFFKTSRHYTKHFAHIWNLCQLMVSYIMKMGRIRLGLHLSPIFFLLKHLIGV